MEPLIPIAAGLIFFLLLMMLGMKLVGARGKVRTKNILDQIAQGDKESSSESVAQSKEDFVASFKAEARGLSKIMLSLPGADSFYVTALKAGYSDNMRSVVLLVLALFVVFMVIFIKLMGPLGIILAVPLAMMIPRSFFKRQIRKRNEAFIDMFPEAIDMIVRSVKSGHPLNTALRMIADNMDPPIGPEFKQVINEVSLGRPVVEALQRMAKRIDEPDIHFFVVVLAVQQETGGNLAEVLGNLSNVIRGRKRLNQKIKALTSEGRATAWVLGSLPIVQLGAIAIFSPDYLEPLFTNLAGNVVLGLACTLIGLAIFITSQMVKVDI
jgi:tight adherence protein B